MATLKCWAAPCRAWGIEKCSTNLRRVSDLRLTWPFSLMVTGTAMEAVKLKVATLTRVEC